MEKKQENVENIIKAELKKEEEKIRREIQDAGMEDLSEEQVEDLFLKLEQRIKKQEQKGAEAKNACEFSEELAADDIYARLSKEDLEALELGRKMKEKQKKVRKKRSRKLYLGLAAAMILVLAIGMTSIGGPERISEVIKQVVGEREVTKVNSDESNMVLENEDEEKAFQEIKDTFGVEPVKIMNAPEGMQFVKMNLDQEFQLAELLYRYKGKNIFYVISTDYGGGSFGIDMEDVLIEKETIENDDTTIELTMYEVQETKEQKGIARFNYKGLEYVLVGTMEKKNFEVILKNLYFYKDGVSF